MKADAIADVPGQRIQAAGLPQMTKEQALSPLDAAFLHVESECTPMHMASVGIFEGGPLRDATGRLRIDDIRRVIASRLPLVPKLRQQACASPLGEAPPVWLDDPEFDVAEHIRVRQLPPPGTEAELRELCAELLAEPLDRTRPLWGLTFVDGLEDRRVALIEKLHHSMADGLGATELATVLLDLEPMPAPDEEIEAWEPHPPQQLWRAAVDDLLRLGEISVKAVAWGGESARHPLRRVREMAVLGRSIRTIITPRILAPRSSLNAQITSARSLEFVRLSFSQMHDVAHAYETTVNDVLLTVVAGGLHDLIEARGELTEKSELQVLVPVGLTTVDHHAMSNEVSALFVRLPIGVKDPLTVLRTVSAEVAREKQGHQPVAVSSFLHLLAPVPQGVLAAGAAIVQHQPFFNLVVTNVPGPPVPLYALGAKLLEAFPVVPLAGNLSLGIAALSYEGQLNLGVLSDPVTCPDVELFCEGVRSSLRTLVEQARVADGG